MWTLLAALTLVPAHAADAVEAATSETLRLEAGVLFVGTSTLRDGRFRPAPTHVSWPTRWM